VTERQLAVDHVVENAAQAPNVRLEGDLDDSGAAGYLALVLIEKCLQIYLSFPTKLNWCYIYIFVYNFFVAINFGILHPIIKDAESAQIWHFAIMPGAEHCYINYNVGGYGTTYSYMHFQAILF
jgi:hypothetical protein